MTATSGLFHPAKVAEATQAEPRSVRKAAMLTMVAAFGALIGGFLIALLLIHGLWIRGDEPSVASGYNTFALLFVMALALERLIQPFTPVLGPDTTVAKANLVDAQAKTAGEPTPAVATAQLRVTDARSKTALVTWGVATGLASMMAACLNVTLMHAVTSSSGTHPPYWIDLLVTGLVVGAGTKPLNDLWSRLQNKPASTPSS